MSYMGSYRVRPNAPTREAIYTLSRTLPEQAVSLPAGQLNAILLNGRNRRLSNTMAAECEPHPAQITPGTSRRLAYRERVRNREHILDEAYESRNSYSPRCSRRRPNDQDH